MKVKDLFESNDTNSDESENIEGGSSRTVDLNAFSRSWPVKGGWRVCPRDTFCCKAGTRISVEEGVTIGKFVRLGNNFTAGAGTKILGNVVIGDNVVIGRATVRPDSPYAPGGGDLITIGDNVNIKGGEIMCSVGQGTSIGERASLNEKTVIGKDVKIGDKFFTYHRRTIWASQFSKLKIIIADGVTIDDGVQFTRNANIPAGAKVTKDNIDKFMVPEAEKDTKALSSGDHTVELENKFKYVHGVFLQGSYMITVNGKAGRRRRYNEGTDTIADDMAAAMGVDVGDFTEWFEDKFYFNIERSSSVKLRGTKGKLETFGGSAIEID